MKNLDSYNKNFIFLENNYELMAYGTNKRVYYRNDNTVFKLYCKKDYLKNEKMIYQTLVKNNINFFVPVTKFLNNYISISHFCNPIKFETNDNVYWYSYGYNHKLLHLKEKNLNYNPIDKTFWKHVCNELVDANGNIPLYNWGFRKNKLLLLDFETIMVDKAIDFLKSTDNIQKFKNSIWVK